MSNFNAKKTYDEPEYKKFLSWLNSEYNRIPLTFAERILMYDAWYARALQEKNQPIGESNDSK